MDVRGLKVRNSIWVNLGLVWHLLRSYLVLNCYLYKLFALVAPLRDLIQSILATVDVEIILSICRFCWISCAFWSHCFFISCCLKIEGIFCHLLLNRTLGESKLRHFILFFFLFLIFPWSGKAHLDLLTFFFLNIESLLSLYFLNFQLCRFHYHGFEVF